MQQLGTERRKMKQYLWTAMMILMSFGFTKSTCAADSPNDILSSYQFAHNAKNIESFVKLVQFRTRDQSLRASWLKEFSATLSSKIAKITLAPFKEFAFMLPESELKQLPVTLKPVNWLAVEFAPQQSDPGRTESMYYLVTIENGKYFIVGP